MSLIVVIVIVNYCVIRYEILERKIRMKRKKVSTCDLVKRLGYTLMTGNREYNWLSG